MIYFMQSGEEGPIKIGYAKNIELMTSRLKSMQTGNPASLKIIKHTKGSHKIEKTLHSKFNNIHIRGEWFKPTKELLGFIEKFNPNNIKIRITKIKRTHVGKQCQVCNKGKSEYLIILNNTAKILVCDNCKYSTADNLINI